MNIGFKILKKIMDTIFVVVREINYRRDKL